MVEQKAALKVILFLVFVISMGLGAIYLGWYLFEHEPHLGVIFCLVLSFLMYVSYTVGYEQ